MFGFWVWSNSACIIDWLRDNVENDSLDDTLGKDSVVAYYGICGDVKVRIKGKVEQFGERSSALPYTSVL